MVLEEIDRITDCLLSWPLLNSCQLHQKSTYFNYIMSPRGFKIFSIFWIGTRSFYRKNTVVSLLMLNSGFFWAFFEGRQGHGCPRKHEFWGNFWPILTRKRSILGKNWFSFWNFAWVLGILPKKAAKKVDLGKISWVLRKILSSFELEFSKNAQKKACYHIMSQNSLKT